MEILSYIGLYSDLSKQMENIFSDTKEKDKLIKKVKFKTYPKEVFQYYKSGGEGDISNIEKPIQDYQGFHYEIDGDEVTFYSFWLKDRRDKEGDIVETSYFVTSIAQFSVFKKYYVNIHDTLSDVVLKNQQYFEIQTMKDRYILKYEQLYETLLKIIRENKVTNTNLIDLKTFVHTSSFLDNLPELKEEWTTEFCYFKNQHLCIENGHKLVKKHSSKILGVIYEKVDDIHLEWSNETKFLNVEYGEEDLTRVLDIYNNTPLDHKEGQVYKLLLANAVTNWFTYFLKDNNLVERKESALIGLKGNRKSFIGFNTYGLFGLNSSYDKSAFGRENNINADLKNMFPIALPRYFDEIPGFSNQMKQRMKDKANGDRTYFTKNNSEMGKDFHFDNSYECITCNSLDLEGDDYDDKQFTYEPRLLCDIDIKKDNKITQQVVRTFSNRVTTNSLILGNYIYKNLLEIDPNELLKGMNIPFDREEKQFMLLLFGEKILNKLGILKDYPLNKEVFISSKLSNNNSVETEVTRFKDCFTILYSYIEDRFNIKTEDFFERLSKNIDSDHRLEADDLLFYKSLNKNGIYIKYDSKEKQFSFVFTSKILPILKRISISSFRKELKYHSLQTLMSIFPYAKQKPKNVLIVVSGVGLTQKQTSGFSIHCNKLMDEIEIFDDLDKPQIEETKQLKEEKIKIENINYNDEVL